MANEAYTQRELVERILYGSEGVKAAEAAIQSALKAFTEATSKQVDALVESNTIYPEMREEMLKIQQRVTEITLEAISSIQNQVPVPPKSDT